MVGKWTRAKYPSCMPLGVDGRRVTESGKHIMLSRQAACEGTILLKNDNAILPLSGGRKIAVFGKAQIDYVKGGGGAGDVCVSYVRNIYEGLKQKQESVTIFDELSLYYDKYVKAQYQIGTECGTLEEPDIPNTLLEEAKAFTDTAIITINRYSQESFDHVDDGTDCYINLSTAERRMIDVVCDNFAHVIVLLNIGAVIDMAWIADNTKIEAALILWQGGMEGGLAAADILVGDETPSGKLVDTCAKSFSDYPSSETFHEAKEYVKYTEDVFTGYRYFETVPGKRERVVYPFGYGLSYTSFEISNVSAWDDGSQIFVTLNVRNTGRYAGKEVLQLYYQSPVGRIAKPAKELCAFAKTPLLKPEEYCQVQLSFHIDEMASYDDMGQIKKSAYVMEAGCYKIWLGTSVRDVECLEYHYVISEDKIIKQCHEYCAPEYLGKRMLADGSYMKLLDEKKVRKEFPCAYVCEYQDGSNAPRMLSEVFEGKLSLDTFLTQLTDAELIWLLRGQENTGVASTGGMGNLAKYGIPNIMTTDGPAGVNLRKDRGVKTTAFPVATQLACTWNLSLVEEIGKAEALEAKENNLCILLAPALNIHRNPLCGRNFEYFSEDPFMSGKMAAAAVKGIQSEKIVAVPKHLACNNKETWRMDSDSILSERALREIYLKGFEICVKEADPKMIMTSYNLINGIRASENTELITGILREEWGYRGMFTSDWFNHAEHYKEVKAGNDISMPDEGVSELTEAYNNGLITRNELAVCAKRILEMILWVD